MTTQAAAKQRFSKALLLDGKGGARKLSDDEVNNWQPADGVLWVDIDQSSKSGRQWLVKKSGINRGIQSILLAGETRPRALLEQDGLVVVLRGINMNPGAIPDDMVAVRVWLQGTRIVTCRRRKILSIDDVADLFAESVGPTSSGDFLVTLTDCLTRRIGSAVENIEQMIEKLDESINSGDIEPIRVQLGVVRRQAAAIRRHLGPQRDALERIVRSHGGLFADAEAFALREEGDQLTRHLEDLDLARENALVTQEELLNRVAMEQNSRMYLLSIVAAIFLPLSFLTGVFGMNVGGLPGVDSPSGFLYTGGAMLAVGIGLVAYFHSKKWL